MSEKRDDHGPFLNTDRELWREPPGDYYASSVHVTESGRLGINVGGTVFVKSLRGWHEAAKDIAAAEERGRRRGVEERDELRACLELARGFVAFQYARNPIPYNEEALARIVKALAPRDSGKEG